MADKHVSRIPLQVAGNLVNRLAKCEDYPQVRDAVMAAIKVMDTRAHVLGDAEFLELYQDALKRRGKTKTRAAKAGGQ